MLMLFVVRIANLTLPIQVDEGESATFHCTIDANPISAKTVREVAIVITDKLENYDFGKWQFCLH